jgi:glycosyltransferase involved in cell wall biosynthesis
MNKIFPKISIIVPIYKVESYLRQCIDSIITQIYTNLEIILVNDGSPDNCGAICDEYAKKDKRIKVLHKKNGGVSSARNAGLNVASGEYLAFVDSDDWIESDMVEVLYQAIKISNADISCCNYYLAYTNSNKVLNDTNETLIFNREQAIKQTLLNKYIFCSVWGKLFKKNLFDTVRFPLSISYGEDAAVMIDILSVIEHVASINIPKYYYRQRKGSLIHITYNSKIIEVLDTAKKLLKIAEYNYPNILKFAEAGLLRTNLDVLSRMIFNKYYTCMPEYIKILSELRKNFRFMIKSEVLSRNEKIKIIAVKINIRLYKFIQFINNQKKSKILFE